jgi:putative ABC transport system permease protein
MGATEQSLSLLLTKEFLALVVIANAIAWPVSYLASQSWLESFAYRAELGLSIFVLAGAGVLVIALATVSLQAVRAALANPVEALRNE